MKKIFLMSYFALSLFLFPLSIFAYTETSQSTIRLSDTTVLYTITYRLSYMNYEIYTPMTSIRALEHGVSFPHVGYSLFKDDGTPVGGGRTYSVVLSDADIVNGKYFVSRSSSAYFTLVTLAELPKGVDVEDVHLRVTTLPFTLTSTDKILQTQLDIQQLSSYRTDLVR